MLHEDGIGPTQWPMGRAVKAYTGKDGMVRVVLVKIRHTIAVKVAPLMAMGAPPEQCLIRH